MGLYSEVALITSSQTLRRNLSVAAAAVLSSGRTILWWTWSSGNLLCAQCSGAVVHRGEDTVPSTQAPLLLCECFLSVLVNGFNGICEWL